MPWWGWLLVGAEVGLIALVIGYGWWLAGRDADPDADPDDSD